MPSKMPDIGLVHWESHRWNYPKIDEMWALLLLHIRRLANSLRSVGYFHFVGRNETLMNKLNMGLGLT